MKYFVTFTLLIFSFSAFAQDDIPVVITLNFGENMPTAEDVHQEGQLSPPPANHIISAFDDVRPVEIKYAMKIRAVGDLKTLIDQKPNWGRSLAERSLLLYYDSSVNITEVESGLNSDKYIQSVSIIPEGKLAATMQNPILKPRNIGTKDDWHLTAVNWYAANNLVDGFGHIGFVDSGSLNDRSEFAPFDLNNGDYIGGGLNESKSYSRFYDDRKVSELRAIDETDLNNGPGLCDDNDNNPGDGVVFPDSKNTGHGTHVSGLFASRSINIPGICQDCSILATQETKHNCVFDSNKQEYRVDPIIDINQYIPSLQYLLDTGVQTATLSFGFPFTVDICFTNPNYYACSTINDAKARNIAIVASAGNDRERMRFPAFHRDVIGVSGIQEDLQFWNESPGGGSNFPPLDPMATQDESNCPSNYSGGQECGSNFSWLDDGTPDPDDVSPFQRVDVSAPAREVMSTLPLESEYNPFVGIVGCTDIADGVLDGYGPCTGTSMSTPIIAGILQLIRSVNPLLPIGDDDPTKLDGIRDILLYSGSEFRTSGQHNPWLGFGVPDTELAIKTTLGVSNGLQVKNRVTPLMVLQNDDFDDTLYTVFPQISLAYALEPSGFYENPQNIPVVNELDMYPVEEVDGSPLVNIVPLAPIYVFTTRWNPLTTNYDLDPLYRMEKEVVSQPDCIPGLDVPVPCQVTDRTTVMVTDENELETLHSQGYELQGIEGYVIPCADSQCPTGPAVKIYRVHDTTTDKYYLTQILPGQGVTFDIIGAGFLNLDVDGDGLTIGMEYLLGTSDNDVDSDEDGLSDGYEYPAAGVPLSDPLVSDIIFEDDFE